MFNLFKRKTDPDQSFFYDLIIPVDQLKTKDGLRHHREKYFKKCTIEDGAILIDGGVFVNPNTIDSVDIIPIPNDILINTKSITLLNNCFFTDCILKDVTIFCPYNAMDFWRKLSVRIAGEQSNVVPFRR